MLAVIGLAQLMVILDATIVNIALPRAQEALGFSLSNRQWIVTAYSLTFGGLLLLGGRLGDIFGKRNAFMVGLIGFGIFSALGGTAGNFTVLVIARAGQGVFGALLAPSALALLTITFTNPVERARAFGIFGAIAGGGGAIGLILGGLLTQWLSWRWCLYVNLIIAIPTLVAAFVLLTRDRPAQPPKHDLIGSVVATGGLFSLVYGFSNAERNGWGDVWTPVFIALGVVLLVLFVFVEMRVSAPLMPLRVLADRNRASSLISMLIAGAVIFGISLFMTYYLQQNLGYSPIRTGVSFLPMVFGIATSIQIGTQILVRVGPRPIVPVGMVLGAVGMVLLHRLDLNSHYAPSILPALIVTGLGLGLIIAPTIQTAISGLAPREASVGSALVTTMQQVGGSIGVALFSTLFASASADYATHHHQGGKLTPALAAIEGYRHVYLWAGIFFVVGAVLAAVLLRTGRIASDLEDSPALVG